MILVLDTNVLVSALAFPGGPPDKIFRSILSGRFKHATSPDILTELRRVLSEILEMNVKEVESMVTLVTQISHLVYPTERIKVIKKDDTDNRILECALTAKSNFLITGDRKHLLPLKGYQGIHILSPGDFVRKWGLA